MKLTDSQILENLSRLPDWILNRGHLEKTFVFPDFARAVLFVNRTVNPIEEQTLYPQIHIRYNRVEISILNPEHGVLTERDFILAKAIEDL